jgi:GT2 family glycosyltransferase
MPEISIITSLYKSESYLNRYLKHAKNLYDNLSSYGITTEFILIVNDVNEKEKDHLSQIELQNLKLIYVPRETLYSSWNRGVREASSNVIAFWNVDDIRFTRAIFNGYNEILTGNQIVYFSFYILGFTKVYILKKRIRILFFIFKKSKMAPYDREKFMKGCMCGPFFMFHREVFDIIGPFDESFIVAGDFDWFARAAKMDISFKYLKNIGGIFFTHFRNLTILFSKTQTEENNLVIERYYNKEFKNQQ